MSGIYIHVPYCKHKCEYCDFYSVESALHMDNFAFWVGKELELRKDFLPSNSVETIYFGGGTPSMLSLQQISDILMKIHELFIVQPKAEITLEANPDDLSLEFLSDLKSIGVNRLSIGIQSFANSDLQKLGRRHNSQQAISAVEWAQQCGFNNISIDLIYGLPYSNSEVWKSNLEVAFGLNIQHLSCYHLIFEKGTPLYKKLQSKTVSVVPEDLSVEQFNILQELSAKHGFVHYEISNLAKEGFFSKHNSSYWNQVPYLGIGPSAHSYNGIVRSWNPRSIGKWKLSLEQNRIVAEEEALSPNDRINDYLLTSLRTMWGANIDFIRKEFGEDVAQHVIKVSQKYIPQGIILKNGDTLCIPPQHFLVSDGVISDFLVV
jgi:oxygen-independent coproporphyrinogen III oxidase